MGRPFIRRPSLAEPPASDLFDKYRLHMRIDKYALDEAMETQAQLYQEVSEGYVNACSLRDQAKSEVERTLASVAAELRIKFSKQGDKFTESQVQNEVVRDARHTRAVMKHQELVKQAAQYASLQASFDQRAKMLKELAGLYVSGYFNSMEARGTEQQVKNAVATSIRRKLANKRKENN